MKSSLPSRVLFAIVLAAAASLHAQSNAARTPPALGLLRLKSEAKPNENQSEGVKLCTLHSERSQKREVSDPWLIRQ